MGRLLREPLLHFLLLGGALFALHGWWVGGAQPESDRIRIGAGQIEHLATAFERTWMRAPTPAELAALIEDHVREEVFYREALAMRLDRDDLVVRRRLRQKLEFLSEDATATAAPSEAELRAYLERHPERFRIDARVSFEHVYFARERDGEPADAAAAALLARFAADGGASAAAELGDPFLLPSAFEGAARAELEGLFGEAFAARVLELEPGRWTGPVESGYGLHLVRVRERSAGHTPELAEVRDAVEREWIAERRAQASEAFYQSLRGRYEVIVEPSPNVASRAVVAESAQP
jgi:hypothetical protein